MSRADFHDRVKKQKTVWAAGAYDAMSAKMIEAAGFGALLASALLANRRVQEACPGA
jgi:2-methylisocitrate lyase-like PEP mutase family enzyme